MNVMLHLQKNMKLKPQENTLYATETWMLIAIVLFCNSVVCSFILASYHYN